MAVPNSSAWSSPTMIRGRRAASSAPPVGECGLALHRLGAQRLRGHHSSYLGTSAAAAVRSASGHRTFQPRVGHSAAALVPLPLEGHRVCGRGDARTIFAMSGGSIVAGTRTWLRRGGPPHRSPSQLSPCGAAYMPCSCLEYVFAVLGRQERCSRWRASSSSSARARGRTRGRPWLLGGEEHAGADFRSALDRSWPSGGVEVHARSSCSYGCAKRMFQAGRDPGTERPPPCGKDQIQVGSRRHLGLLSE